MVKKKQNKIYKFRVPYEVQANAQGTAIVEVGEDELQFKYGKVDMDSLRADMIDQIPYWSEGTQTICEPASSGSWPYGVAPDYDTQCDEWCYYPEHVEVGEIEDITDEVDVVDRADVSIQRMEAYLPFKKKGVRNPEFHEVAVPHDVPRPIRIWIEVLPEGVKIEANCNRRTDFNNALKWLVTGDISAETKKKALEIQKLICSCIKN